VYLGLAPGIEAQKLRDLLTPAGLYIEFPHRTIPITSHQNGGNGSGGGQDIPLRLGALRDQSLCRVERTGLAGDVAGFERVRLVFELSRAPMNGHESNGYHNGHSDEKPPAVVAFLLTIGMPRESEKHFFNGVITEFLDHSWASFPKLLKEVGCADPSTAN
jgi:hypothetical protein